MARGGKRNGSGRKKGEAGPATVKTREVANRMAADGGVTPLQVMMEAMRHSYEAKDLDKAAAFAKDAAPYMHPRLSAVTLSGDEDDPVRIVEELVIVDAKDIHPPAAAAP